MGLDSDILGVIIACSAAVVFICVLAVAVGCVCFRRLEKQRRAAGPHHLRHPHGPVMMFARDEHLTSGHHGSHQGSVDRHSSRFSSYRPKILTGFHGDNTQPDTYHADQPARHTEVANGYAHAVQDQTDNPNHHHADELSTGSEAPVQHSIPTVPASSESEGISVTAVSMEPQQSVQIHTATTEYAVIDDIPPAAVLVQQSQTATDGSEFYEEDLPLPPPPAEYTEPAPLQTDGEDIGGGGGGLHVHFYEQVNIRLPHEEKSPQRLETVEEQVAVMPAHAPSQIIFSGEDSHNTLVKASENVVNEETSVVIQQEEHQHVFQEGIVTTTATMETTQAVSAVQEEVTDTVTDVLILKRNPDEWKTRTYEEKADAVDLGSECDNAEAEFPEEETIGRPAPGVVSMRVRDFSLIDELAQVQGKRKELQLKTGTSFDQDRKVVNPSDDYTVTDYISPDPKSLRVKNIITTFSDQPRVVLVDNNDKPETTTATTTTTTTTEGFRTSTGEDIDGSPGSVPPASTSTPQASSEDATNDPTASIFSKRQRYELDGSMQKYPPIDNLLF